MTLRIWTGAREFETTHERRALTRLVREMVSRFGEAPEPYALFVDFSVRTARIDLLALTARAIVLIDLKEAGRPDGVVRGTENGPWEISFPDGSGYDINVDRRNPYQQLDAHRYAFIQWLEREGDTIFGAQRRAQLDLRQVSAWVTIVPAVNEAASRANLTFLPHQTTRWFAILGFDHLCAELYATVSRGIQLTADDMENIACRLGLFPRTRLADIVLPGDLIIPQPRVFGKPYVPRLHLDREQEIACLRDAVFDPTTTLLVIGGTGGAGKTHLAGKVCEVIADRCRIYWIDCADIPELTLETLLLAFANKLPDSRRAHIVADPDESQAVKMDIVLEYLDDQRACLILDDYHLLNPNNDLRHFIRRLDKKARAAKVLLTSRRRPDFLQDVLAPIKGCWEITLSGLPVAQTIPYLQQQPAGRRLHLAESDGPLIWERTGGGIPRVLDMLACLSMGRSPAEVAAQLAIYDDQQAANWFQSLMALVSKDARRLADAASVVRGAIPPAMLDALSDSTDVAGLVNELVDSYILDWQETSRQYTLNSLLRDYLYSRLHPTTRRRYHDRAAKYLFNATDAALTEHEQISLRVEALYHAHEAENWALILREANSVLELLNSWGEWLRARRICEWALEAAEKTNKPEAAASWSLDLARQLRHMGELDRCADLCQKGLALAERLKSRQLRAKAYHQAGMLALARHDLIEARACHTKALELERVLGNKPHIAQSLGKLGDIERAENHFEAALACYSESVQLSEELGDSAAMAITYTQMGTLAKYSGDLHQAQGYYERSLRHAERVGRPLSRAIAVSQLAEIAGRLGDYNRALELIDQGLALLCGLPQTRSYLISLGIRADILIAAGRLDEAELILDELTSHDHQQQDSLGTAFNQKRRGLLAIYRGDVEGGARMVREALAFFAAKGLMHYAQDAEQSLARALATTGKA